MLAVTTLALFPTAEMKTRDFVGRVRDQEWRAGQPC
jgi:hypothetical protein